MSTFPDDASDDTRQASSDDTRQASSDDTRWAPSDDTGWDHPDGGTQPLDTQDTHPLLTDDPTRGGSYDTGSDGTAAETAGEPSPGATVPGAVQPRALPRPSGPSWSTIAFGLVCLVVAGGALLVEFSEMTLDWDRTGPLALVGMGLLLVLVGLAALVRRGDSEEEFNH